MEKEVGIRNFTIIPVDSDIYIFVGEMMTGKTMFANKLQTLGGTNKVVYHDINSASEMALTMDFIAHSYDRKYGPQYQIMNERPMIILITNSEPTAIGIFNWLRDQRINHWSGFHFYEALKEGKYQKCRTAMKRP